MSNEQFGNMRSEGVRSSEPFKQRFESLAKDLTDGGLEAGSYRIAFFKLEDKRLVEVGYRVHMFAPKHSDRPADVRDALAEMTRKAGSVAKVEIYPFENGAYPSKIRYELRMNGDFKTRIERTGDEQIEIDRRAEEFAKTAFNKPPSESARLAREMGIDPEAGTSAEMKLALVVMEYILPNKESYQISDDTFDALIEP